MNSPDKVQNQRQKEHKALMVFVGSSLTVSFIVHVTALQLPMSNLWDAITSAPDNEIEIVIEDIPTPDLEPSSDRPEATLSSTQAVKPVTLQTSSRTEGAMSPPSPPAENPLNTQASAPVPSTFAPSDRVAASGRSSMPSSAEAAPMSPAVPDPENPPPLLTRQPLSVPEQQEVSSPLTQFVSKPPAPQSPLPQSQATPVAKPQPQSLPSLVPPQVDVASPPRLEETVPKPESRPVPLPSLDPITPLTGRENTPIATQGNTQPQNQPQSARPLTAPTPVAQQYSNLNGASPGSPTVATQSPTPLQPSGGNWMGGLTEMIQSGLLGAKGNSGSRLSNNQLESGNANRSGNGSNPPSRSGAFSQSSNPQTRRNLAQNGDSVNNSAGQSKGRSPKSTTPTSPGSIGMGSPPPVTPKPTVSSTKPVCIRCPIPEYRGSEGSPRLVYDIAPDGKVINVRLRESSGDSQTDTEAIQTLQRWRYDPKSVVGGRQNIRIRITFEEQGSNFQRQNQERRQQIIQQQKTKNPVRQSPVLPAPVSPNAPTPSSTPVEFLEPNSTPKSPISLPTQTVAPRPVTTADPPSSSPIPLPPEPAPLPFTPETPAS